MPAMTTSDLLAALINKNKDCDCENCRKERGEETALKSQEIQARVLLDSYALLSRPMDLVPGLLITPKRGLFSGYNLRENAVLVITRVFNPPLQGLSQATNHFARILDIAVLEDDPKFGPTEYVVDSRYFEPYTGEIS